MQPIHAEIPKPSREEQAQLIKRIKNGIYKELHRQKLIQDEQLHILLQQNRQDQNADREA